MLKEKGQDSEGNEIEGKKKGGKIYMEGFKYFITRTIIYQKEDFFWNKLIRVIFVTFYALCIYPLLQI